MKALLMVLFTSLLFSTSIMASITCSDAIDTIKVSSRVIAGRHDRSFVGTVKEVFGNQALLEIDNNSTLQAFYISSLSLGFRCVGGMCEKDRVLLSGGFPGTVIEVFSNRMVKVKLDPHPGYTHKGFEYRYFSELRGVSPECANWDIPCSCLN